MHSFHKLKKLTVNVHTNDYVIWLLLNTPLNVCNSQHADGGTDCFLCNTGRWWLFSVI